MLLLIPVVPEKCFRYTSQLVVLSPGCEYSSLLASSPPHVRSRCEHTPQFHSLPAYRQQVAALLLFYGLVVALGHLCYFMKEK